MDNERFQTTVLEHMVRMTQEITELRSEQKKMGRHMVVIEKDMHDKFGVVFDFIDEQKRTSKEVLDDLKGLHKKVDRLELETAHVRRIM